MTSEKFSPPPARPSVAAKDLARPDWTAAAPRRDDMLWLDKNENSDPVLAGLSARILADIPPSALYSYPETAPLYRKLGNYLDLSPDRLLLAAGSDGIIRSAFEAYIEPGDVVVHSSPTFAMYGVYCRIYGARAVTMNYQPSNQGPALALDTALDTIRGSGAKLVCLPNPDSPTGTVFAPDELRAIVEAAGEIGALMLIDEAYYPFYDQTVLPWVSDYGHLIVTRSTGKAWGMAGYRIGYGATSPDIAKTLHKVRAMYETGAVVAAVFERMLDHESDMLASVARLQDGKALFLAKMRDLGFQTLNGHGNFLHVNFAGKAQRVHAALADMVYYRANFKDPCLKGFSRLSSTTAENFHPLIDRIKSVCKE